MKRSLHFSEAQRWRRRSCWRNVLLWWSMKVDRKFSPSPSFTAFLGSSHGVNWSRRKTQTSLTSPGRSWGVLIYNPSSEFWVYSQCGVPSKPRSLPLDSAHSSPRLTKATPSLLSEDECLISQSISHSIQPSLLNKTHRHLNSSPDPEGGIPPVSSSEPWLTLTPACETLKLNFQPDVPHNWSKVMKTSLWTQTTTEGADQWTSVRRSSVLPRWSRGRRWT